MKKYILLIVIPLLVGVGLGFSIPHGAKEAAVGGGNKLDQHFVYGLNAGLADQFTVDSSGNVSSSGIANATTVTASIYKTATVGSSSSSPAALGSAAAGHLVVAASATTANASTTAVTANSSIYLTQELVTPIAGTTCNTALASGTAVSLVVPANGFQMKVQPAPTASPTALPTRLDCQLYGRENRP